MAWRKSSRIDLRLLALIDKQYDSTLVLLELTHMTGLTNFKCEPGMGLPATEPQLIFRY